MIYEVIANATRLDKDNRRRLIEADTISEAVEVFVRLYEQLGCSRKGWQKIEVRALQPLDTIVTLDDVT